jgi:uncharacterized membrane protein YgcG
VKQSAELRRKWLTFAVLGLLLTGLGLSLVGEAILAKMAQQAYFIWGTAGLVAFNAGLSIFGQGVIFRYRYLKAHGREESDRRAGQRRHRGRGRKRPGGSGSGGGGQEGGGRSTGFKSRFEE